MQLEGSRGPLTAARSKAILGRLEIGTLDTPTAFFQQLSDSGIEVIDPQLLCASKRPPDAASK